jgi:hypothetical protein
MDILIRGVKLQATVERFAQGLGELDFKLVQVYFLDSIIGVVLQTGKSVEKVSADYVSIEPFQEKFRKILEDVDV